LPQPFGPTTPTSWPGSTKLVGSANDLKPESLMELRRTENPRRRNKLDYYPSAESKNMRDSGENAHGRVGK
jgi:hypothetical protein